MPLPLCNAFTMGDVHSVAHQRSGQRPRPTDRHANDQQAYDLDAAFHRHYTDMLSRIEELFEIQLDQIMSALSLRPVAKAMATTTWEPAQFVNNAARPSLPFDDFKLYDEESTGRGIAVETVNAETQTDSIGMMDIHLETHGDEEKMIKVSPNKKKKMTSYHHSNPTRASELRGRRQRQGECKEKLEERTKQAVNQQLDVEILEGLAAANAFVDAEDEREMQRNKLDRTSCLAKIVCSEKFDIAMGSTIVINALVVGIRLELHGFITAGEVGLANPARGYPRLDLFFALVDSICVFIFLIESIMRVLVFKKSYFMQFFNWLDIFVIIAGIAELVAVIVTNVQDFPNLTCLRLIRLVKVIKALRFIRVMRLFNQLRVMIVAIGASIGASIWSMAFLAAVQIIAAILMTQITIPIIANSGVSLEIQRECYQYFGRTTYSLLTLYQITMAPGPWAPIGRLFIFKVNAWYVLFFVPYGWVVSFAVVRVICALFLKQTLQQASGDGEVAIMERMQKKEQDIRKLRDIFQKGDTDGSGQIDFGEFQAMLNTAVVKSWLSLLDLDVHDMNTLFLLLDDGDGKVSFDEFISGVMRCRGAARGVDVAALLAQSKTLLDDLKGIREVAFAHTDTQIVKALEAFPENDDEVKPMATIVLAKLGEKNERRGIETTDARWKRFVKSRTFDVTAGIVIILSAVAMGFDLELKGLREGVEIGFGNEKDEWPRLQTILDVMDHSFTILFFLEMCARIAAYGKDFFYRWVNWVDIVTVITPILELYVLSIFFTAHALEHARFLRLFRLLRLTRVARIMRIMTLFVPLRVLLESIIETVGTLGWAFVLMSLIQALASIFITESLRTYWADESRDSSLRKEVYLYFGRWSHSMLTMHEMTMAPAAWGPIGRLIIFNVDWALAVFFVLYGGFVTFAVVNVISAIFLKRTLAAAAGDGEVAIMERVYKKLKDTETLKEIFQQGDQDGSGSVDWNEFEAMIQNPRVRAWLGILELDISDMATVFNLLDDGDGNISFEEFITGVMKCRGAARGVEVVALLAEVRKISFQVCAIKKWVNGEDDLDEEFANICAKDM